jgi:H+-translocating NAD(P) transhydrogenase subunit alpha
MILLAYFLIPQNRSVDFKKKILSYTTYILFMIIGVLKEPNYEKRVSLLPEAVATLIKKNITVLVESDAGLNAFANNTAYEAVGAKITSADEIHQTAHLVLAINVFEKNVKADTIYIGIFQPLFNTDLMQTWTAAKASVFSLDMLPRTTRAQSMDVLSSQANIAGYKAVLKAANLFPRYFPMFMTAAGSITPAKVLILGAGVAGLQAIATAKRLGAVIEVFDTRPAVKEEVQSLGAKFVEVEGAADASKAGGYGVEQTEEYKQKQQQKIAESIAKADIVISTAQIPGRKAPILIPTTMVDGMKAGSVIVDIAASTGGNCELTKNNETVLYKGVQIVGDSFLPTQMPMDASKLYGKNVLNFLQLIIDKENNLNLNWEDDLVEGCCIAHNGEIKNERVKAP